MNNIIINFTFNTGAQAANLNNKGPKNYNHAPEMIKIKTN